MASPTPIEHSEQHLERKKAVLSGLTLRSVLIGAILAILTVWLVTYAELVTGQIMIGYLQAPPAAVFLLFLVAASNFAWAKINSRSALKSSELATIYAMMVPAAMVASHGMLQRILPVMPAENYYANRSNGWVSLYFPHTSPLLIMWNKHGLAKQLDVVEFYESLRRGEALPWHSWIVPVAFWLLLFAFVYGVFFAMAAILRKQWVENEHLTFPLIQLPLDLMSGLSDDSGASSGGVVGFFSNRLAWWGFGIPCIVFAINGMHHIWPGVPLIPLTLPLNRYLTTPPWNGVSYMTFNFSFAAIGFFFLLPTEILFSLWFFYLFAKAEEIMYVAFGNPMPPALHADAKMMIGAQLQGAWIALAIVYLLLAKPHLKAVWRAVISRSANERGEGEMLSYRASFWLLIGCFLGIVGWCAAAGMSAWLAVCVFGLYLFVQALIMARSTAEGGMIMTEGCWTPSDIISLGIPLHSLGSSNLTVLAYIDAVFTRDLRGILLTALLDMQKLAEMAGLYLKSLRGALLISLIISAFFGCVLQIWLPYHKGASSMYSYMYDTNAVQFFHEYSSAMKPGPTPPSFNSLWYAVLGVFVTVLLVVLRARVGWWPLHPLGYALCGSWTVVIFWVSMLVAWIIKCTVLRYGGIRLYRLVRPFFIGLILGELSSAGFWTLVSSFSQITAPQFPWP